MKYLEGIRDFPDKLHRAGAAKHAQTLESVLTCCYTTGSEYETELWVALNRILADSTELDQDSKAMLVTYVRQMKWNKWLRAFGIPTGV